MDVFLTGVDTAECEGITVKSKRGSIVGNMARKLIDAGRSPDDILHVYHGKTLCFKPATISAWAGMTVTESDGVSVRFAKYSPMGDVFNA